MNTRKSTVVCTGTKTMWEIYKGKRIFPLHIRKGFTRECVCARTCVRERKKETEGENFCVNVRDRVGSRY